MFVVRPWTLVLAIVCLSLTLASCGNSSSGNHVTQQQPVFTSAPPSTAAQGSAYSYQVAATDPAGGSITYALTTSPTGAAISNGIVSWTPTAAQSRNQNSFTVTATTSGGASATQSWAVTPTGIVTVNFVNTYWEPAGPVQVPANAVASLTVSAVVPQADGSLTVLKGATSSPGVISIAGVPAGNYWLAFGGVNLLPDSTSAYWTNTSTFDAGRDIAGSPPAILNGSTVTRFNLNFSGLDPVGVPTSIYFQPVNNTASLPIIDSSSGTSLSIALAVTGNIDWSQLNALFLGQYEPSTLGVLNNGVLGPSFLLTNPGFQDNATNTVTETLQSTPTSIDVNVPGTQWASMLSNTSPAAATAYAGSFSLLAQPFVIGRSASTAIPQNFVMAATSVQTGLFFGVDPFGGGCDSGFPLFPATTPAILTDTELGTLQYSDPFPSSWNRAETICQEALVPIAIPNSSATANFALVDGEAVPPSSSPLAPVVGPVQSPTINAGSLYTAATLNTTTPTLSWSAPLTGSAYGYRVSAYVQISANGLETYEPAGAFYTSQTSVTLPPLSAGNTYVFAITALVDGASNIQTAPFRSALPAGFANVISAPITISSGASQAVIHGDRRVIRRFSQPRRTDRAPQAWDLRVASMEVTRSH